MVMQNGPTLVAELGCNHQGNLARALEMIDVAAATKSIEFVKFQKRNPRELLSAEKYASPHPNAEHSFGETYGLHREHLEFSIQDHLRLRNHCESRGVGYACSVWDPSSALQVIGLMPEYIKVPSASNLNFAMLDILARKFSGQLHISLGMTSALELDRIEHFLESRNCLERTIFYACTSAYPTQAEHCHLLEIQNLKARFRGRTAGTGYSGHHLGTTLDIVAYTLGAEWIERHFTLDRSLKGTDQALSLLPSEFSDLKRNLNQAKLALTTKTPDLSEIEMHQRQKLKDL